MPLHTWFRAKFLVLPLLLTLIVALACGTSSTSTPRPTVRATAATTGPTATAVATARPTAAPTPTVAARPRIDRVVLAWTGGGVNSSLSWVRGRTEMFDERPAMEYLIGQNRNTGAYIPELAEKWEVTPDARNWTVNLRKGIRFHEAQLGEFTAADVRHTVFLMTQPDSIFTDVTIWRSLTGQVKEDTPAVAAQKLQDAVEIKDPYTVVFHLKGASPEFFNYIAHTKGMGMQSKARWDSGGLEAYKKRSVGTGPFEMVERKENGIVTHKRVENHWRQTAEFRELEIRPVPEEGTRVAALATEEVHLAPVSRNLYKQVEGRGMKIVSSKSVFLTSVFQFGGLYMGTPNEFDPKLPWADKRVRQAMNMAINREAINKNIFEGNAFPAKVFGFHPSRDEIFWPGVWNPEWDRKFDELYGYNPTKAKQLLAEAGYPNGFEFPFIIFITPIPGNPDVEQVVARDFQAIGLRPKIEERERAAMSLLWRQRKLSGMIHFNGGAGNALDVVRVQHANQGIVHAFTHPEIQNRLDAIEKTANIAERTRLLREIGDYSLNEFATMPMAWFFTDIAVNPKFITEYVFQGLTEGYYTHLEYLKLTR